MVPQLTPSYDTFHLSLSLSLLARYDREEPLYDYEKPEFSPGTGHFTQVIS